VDRTDKAIRPTGRRSASLPPTEIGQVAGFIDSASYPDICEWLANLAASDRPESIDLLRAALLTRSGDTYAKHYIPKVATWALLRRGPAGVRALLELAADPETPGAIYPQSIIETLWAASVRTWPHLLQSPAGGADAIDLSPLDDATVEAAGRALEDLFAELASNEVLFDRVFAVIYLSNLLPPMDGVVKSTALDLLTRASIKLSPSLLRDFERLQDVTLSEETYQRFLETHPVFLDPLASQVFPKSRLGLEHATDFAIRRFDGRYVLVEIERPDTPIVTKQLDLSAPFNHAFGQVLDFQRWVEDNGAYAQRHLPGIASPRGLLVIGMRRGLSSEAQLKLRRFNANSATIEVVTFDDVLVQARNLYENLRHRPLTSG
jgi:hypothetical protein